jgi:DNA-binding transcriptional MerR regulator
MADSPLALLRAHARHAPWNARGLAAHVTALVDSAGVRPTNASARAAPSARAVRFYVANSLMDRPDGVGTSATYNYRHFLQLLAIKLRQREGSTLEGIRKEMKDTTGDALERRVAQSLAPVLVTGRPGAAELDDEVPASWRRVHVADGIELHLRADSPAARDDTVVALREAIRSTPGRSEA